MDDAEVIADELYRTGLDCIAESADATFLSGLSFIPTPFYLHHTSSRDIDAITIRDLVKFLKHKSGLDS